MATWSTIFNDTVTTYNDIFNIPSLADLEFAQYEIYRVTLDGNEYIRETSHFVGNGYNVWVVGNVDLVTDSSVTTGDPFVVYNVGWGALYCNVRNGGNGTDHTFKLEKQISSSGTTVYNKVTINGTTYIDLSTDTVADASHIRQGYVGHLNDGTSVTGTYAGSSPNLQAKSNISPTTSSQTIQPDSGYDGLSSVQINAMPSGTAGTPTATKGTVSNHQVSVTPSVTNTTGYITGSTKTGTAVTVSASELVSGSETKTANGTYDVTNLAQLVVNVSGSSGKNVQVEHGTKRIANSAYTDVGYEITVAKTGTYNVYWAGWRSSTSGTNGAQLYVNGTASGNAVTTFDSTWTNVQNGSRTSVSLTQGDKVTLSARSRGTSYYMYIFFLSIEET